MITGTSIVEYLKYQPKLTQEVFLSLISNESPSTKKVLLSATESARKMLRDSGRATIVATKGWEHNFFSTTDLDVSGFMEIMSQESEKKAQGIFYKINKFFFGGMAYKAIGYVLDLDLSNLSQKEMLLVGDAILLAGIYLKLMEKA